VALVFRKVSRIQGDTVRYWALLTAFNSGDLAVPLTDNGRAYRCIATGTTGATEPTWPTTQGGMVSDGSVTWQEATILDLNLLQSVPAGPGLGILGDPDFGPLVDNPTILTQSPYPGGLMAQDQETLSGVNLKVRANTVSKDRLPNPNFSKSLSASLA
jgi:hypothetical protein